METNQKLTDYGNVKQSWFGWNERMILCLSVSIHLANVDFRQLKTN